MNSILNSILIMSFIAFDIIAIIPIIFENIFAQREETEQRQNQSTSPTLDDNNDGMIISEEICPPYCSPPPPIQGIPKEQTS